MTSMLKSIRINRNLQKHLRLLNADSKVRAYKDNFEKSIAFFYISNENFDFEIKNAPSFTSPEKNEIPKNATKICTRVT